MDEYIDRQAAQRLFADRHDYGLARELDKIPAADVVEVVRCRNCKHLMFSDCYGECAAGHYGIVQPDHFCSYGKRKDGE